MNILRLNNLYWSSCFMEICVVHVSCFQQSDNHFSKVLDKWSFKIFCWTGESFYFAAVCFLGEIWLTQYTYPISIVQDDDDYNVHDDDDDDNDAMFHCDFMTMAMIQKCFWILMILMITRMMMMVMSRMMMMMTMVQCSTAIPWQWRWSKSVFE